MEGTVATSVTGLAVEWLGRVSYSDALALQEAAVEARRHGATGDRLLLLEHPPVITLGSSSHAQNLLVDEKELARRGVEVHRVRRGGDVTCHAPGQLVGYLIVDLAARRSRDVHRFLRRIEAALIDALAALGLPARSRQGMTGVFVEPAGEGPAASCDRKIASIGIAVRHWVTYHGFALNVGPDLSGFDAIVPCGLQGVEMTSVARELALDGALLEGLAERVRERVGDAFRNAFPDPPEDLRVDDLVPAVAPPLEPFGLVLHHDGRWSHDGQPLTNAKLRARFDRAVRYLPEEGKYVVQISRFRGQIEIEEAGFFVRSFDGKTGVIRLSDGCQERLDVASLRVSQIDGALLCSVKRDLVPAGLTARFRHSPHADLMNAIDDDGEALWVGDQRLTLPELESPAC
jgi:lipoyl(octanoyl) transferase